MQLTRVVAWPLAAVTLAFVTLAASPSLAQQADDLVGDPARGKIVYRTVGGCISCHGWPADGRTGINMQSPTGANLRETTLDKDSLIEVVKCGRPGTAMPFHDRAAYRDDRCFGLVMSDFDSGDAPKRGKTFSEQDIVNLVAYLQADVVGRGKPTHAECIDFFDNPAAKACVNLK